jgi:hypothetical protein
MYAMNFIRQKLVTLQNRARDLQTTLRRWALYDDSVSRELKEELLARLTPGEQSKFDADLELTKDRLRPISTQLQTVSTWYDYVLQKINDQLDQTRSMLDQGRHQECLAVLNDVEMRMMNPNEETLGFFFRALGQYSSHESHQKLACIEALIRDLYLPPMKITHERGLAPKECLARTPVAYLTDAPDAHYTWRLHAQRAMSFGRRLPLSMMAVPRKYVAQPWNLVAVAHEVGLCLYADLDLGWEIANKLQTESINTGVSPQTAALWARWHETIFADVFGVLKLGPAYVGGMIELLGTDANSALNIAPDSPVPPAYLRWHIMLQTLQLLNFNDQSRELFNQIHLLCGDPNQLARQCGPIWQQLINECRAVAGLIAFSPCQKLGTARVVDVVTPFLATDLQNAIKIKELLLAGDESCSSDEDFTWCEPLKDIPVTTLVALAGLRMAFDVSADYDASRRIWVRFWCLMQSLTQNVEQTRDREDREFAPGDATLKTLAQQAVPAMA